MPPVSTPTYPVCERGASILVVVDMQMHFRCALEPWLLDAVESNVRQANQAGWSIIALEIMTFNPLRTYGNTHERIVIAAQPPASRRDHPPRFFMRAKAQSDGSDRVQDVCEKENFSPTLIRVCGVKSRHCVESTAVALAERYPHCRIEVVAGACNQDAPDDWTGFPVRPNLFLTNR
jgi:hypothetical protein